MANILTALPDYKRVYHAIVNISALENDWDPKELQKEIKKQLRLEKACCITYTGKSLNEKEWFLKFTEGQKAVPNDRYLVLFTMVKNPNIIVFDEEFDWDAFENSHG